MSTTQNYVRELLQMAKAVAAAAGTHDGHRALELEATDEISAETRNRAHIASMTSGRRLRTEEAGAQRAQGDWSYTSYRNEAKQGIWSLPPSQAITAIRRTPSGNPTINEMQPHPEITIPAFVEAVRQRVGIVTAIDSQIEGVLGSVMTNPDNQFNAAAIDIVDRIRVADEEGFDRTGLTPTDAPTIHSVWDPQRVNASLDGIEDDDMTLGQWEQLMNWTTQVLDAAEHIVNTREINRSQSAAWGAPRERATGPEYLDLDLD